MGVKRVGAEISAKERWGATGESYVATIDSPYQRHRLTVIKSLFPAAQELAGSTVVDFGCGDGVLLQECLARGAVRAIGIDFDARMVAAAKRNIPEADIIHGGVEKLAQVERVDFLISANVLAYLSADEDDLFYRASARAVRPGGCMLVTHSNALFDLFTLNAHTVDFFKRRFGVDASSLLTNPQPNRASFNIRENPISYKVKLALYNFHEEAQAFMNFHEKPPLLSGDDPDDMQRERRDTLDWPQEDRWRLMFQCSMFASRCRRA